MKNLQEKYDHLRKNIRSLGRVAVAFSGGVDSTFLLKAAHDVLGDRVVAITARSASFPRRELAEATAFAGMLGVEHIVFDSDELEIEGFSENPPNRCYLCKRELFSKMKQIALENGISEVVEGSNLDDLGDYRPGLTAIQELGVKSPLRHSGLTKDEIRQLSRELGLSTWEKPSFACLSSRFPYGQRITPEKLRMVEEAEQLLMDLGFSQVRVRYHDTLARIEIIEDQFNKILEKEIRDHIYRRIKEIGFTYVSLDLTGYRTGSMNETLK